MPGSQGGLLDVLELVENRQQQCNCRFFIEDDFALPPDALPGLTVNRQQYRALNEADLQADLAWLREHPGRMFHLRRASAVEFTLFLLHWTLVVRLDHGERGTLPVPLGLPLNAPLKEWDTETRCQALFEFLTSVPPKERAA